MGLNSGFKGLKGPILDVYDDDDDDDDDHDDDLMHGLYLLKCRHLRKPRINKSLDQFQILLFISRIMFS